MFKLQIDCLLLGWVDYPSRDLDRIPEGVDALAWLRREFPASGFRVVRQKEVR